MPADRNRPDDAPIGLVPVDSLFSPVTKVSYRVENTREGQILDYDKLIMEVETDGSITPRDALASAGSTLRTLVQLVEEMSDEPEGLTLGEAPAAASGSYSINPNKKSMACSCGFC